MISEKTFASTYNSVWQELIPTGEGFVRLMNLARLHFDNPIKSNSDPKRRALINELAFLLFKTSAETGKTLEEIFKSEESRDQIGNQGVTFIQRFKGSNDDKASETTDDEWRESLEISKRFRVFLRYQEIGAQINTAPSFQGCGFIDDCAGDVLVGDTLYEVKAGDRPFRLVDVRQAVVYLALNHVSAKYQINHVGFVNTRLGTYYKVKATQFAFGISGKSLIELLSEIIDFISSGGVSR